MRPMRHILEEFENTIKRRFCSFHGFLKKKMYLNLPKAIIYKSREHMLSVELITKMETMQFKGLVLDEFQIKATQSIEKNHSVIVSAGTGTGKTLIADYLINKFLKHGKRVIYTAPIKALSNQKFKDFKEDFGEENIGIMTGDVVINPNAPILIMTTEIYRNMLLTKDPVLLEIKYVVFDEIHYINDIERGTVWEESIIFSPAHMRFLCLSATIPNARDFAKWIESIKHHTVDVVMYMKRAVPLQHHLYDVDEGITIIERLRQRLKQDRFPAYYEIVPGKKRRKRQRMPLPHHLDVIKDIYEKHWTPCVFFCFGRKTCETKAEEAAKKYDFTNAKEKTTIINIMNKHIKREFSSIKSVMLIKKIVSKGIGVHHAGMLPFLKNAVEELFGKGLLRFLYATETFAVGINMPAKSVCFNTLDKYDGTTFRPLNTKEYFQMAGRAGRRGIDREGHSIVLIDRNRADLSLITRITSKDVEPIISQFRLSINGVLSMLKNHSDREIEVILKSNFDYYLRKKSQKQVRIMASYNNKLKLLRKKKYIKGKHLTEKGAFASHIYSNELLITDLCFTFPNISPEELILLLAAIEYERRGDDRFVMKHTKLFENVMKRLSNQPYLLKSIGKLKLKKLAFFVQTFLYNYNLNKLLDISSFQEGDIIRIFRRIIDMLKQIEHASQDFAFRQKCLEAIQLIDKEIVKVEL